MTTVVRDSLKDKDSSNSSSNEDLEYEIVANENLLDEKIALGENISKLLEDTNTKDESLSKKHRETFDLYQSRKLVIKPNDDVIV